MAEVEPKRVSKALVLIRESPLDSTGFFKNGRVHDTIHNRVTCGCLNCGRLAQREVLKGGVFKEAEVELVLRRYRDIALKARQIRRSRI